MLPKGPLGRQMLQKLKVYAGPTHPHVAQGPVSVSSPPRRAADDPIRHRTRSTRDQTTDPDHRPPQGSGGARADPGRERSGQHQRAPDRAVLHHPDPPAAAVEALRLTQTADVYDVDATIGGAGSAGSRCAPARDCPRPGGTDDELRPTLKKAGLLARDAREKERRSTG